MSCAETDGYASRYTRCPSRRRIRRRFRTSLFFPERAVSALPSSDPIPPPELVCATPQLPSATAAGSPGATLFFLCPLPGRCLLTQTCNGKESAKYTRAWTSVPPSGYEVSCGHDDDAFSSTATSPLFSRVCSGLFLARRGNSTYGGKKLGQSSCREVMDNSKQWWFYATA